MKTRKNKFFVSILIIFTILLPVAWLVFCDMVIARPNFSKDVYLDKSSIEIVGDSDIQIKFNLTNSSRYSFANKFLHINAVKDGKSGGLYQDYTLEFIEADSTLPVTITTTWSKDEVDGITVSFQESPDSGVYTNLGDFNQTLIGQIITYVGFGLVITAGVLMLNKALKLQVKDY